VPADGSVSRLDDRYFSTASIGAGGCTHNETRFGAAGHSASWHHGTIRYAVAAAYADAKSAC